MTELCHIIFLPLCDFLPAISSHWHSCRPPPRVTSLFSSPHSSLLVFPHWSATLSLLCVDKLVSCRWHMTIRVPQFGDFSMPYPVLCWNVCLNEPSPALHFLFLFFLFFFLLAHSDMFSTHALWFCSVRYYLSCNISCIKLLNSILGTADLPFRFNSLNHFWHSRLQGSSMQAKHL